MASAKQTAAGQTCWSPGRMSVTMESRHAVTRLHSALLSAAWAGELSTLPAVRNIMRTSWN